MASGYYCEVLGERTHLQEGLACRVVEEAETGRQAGGGAVVARLGQRTLALELGTGQARKAEGGG